MTIKDIARLAGVSVSTVSRVMNDHPDVSKEAKEKVLAIVNETGYVPNSSARNLGMSTSDNIGLIVKGISNPFYTEVIYEIGERIAKAGYTMVMQQIPSDENEVMVGAMMERDKRLQGLIFLGGKLDYSKEDIATINVPFVCCSFNNQFGNLDKTEYSSVSIDDNQAAYDAVIKLHRKGHRKIAIVLADEKDESISQTRFEGYKRALHDFDLDLDPNLIIKTNSYKLGDTYIAVKKWLEIEHDFTAIFSISDNMAIASIRALRESGYNVPDDCSVVAIDGIEISEYTNPQLSTLCQPMRDLGAKAVEILIDIIEEKGHHEQVILPTTFRRGSTIKEIKNGN